MLPDMHPGQVRVAAAAVRRLVDDQFPQWRRLSVTAVDSRGTVNALFRIGSQLVARFPLQPIDDPDVGRLRLAAEAAAARELLGRTRFATPEPVALGAPGAGYRWPWTVQTWVPGTVAAGADVARSTRFAHDVAEFIGGVRGIDTAGRVFSGGGRGGDLRSHDEWVQRCLERSKGMLDVRRLRAVWAVLRELPAGSGGDVMSHTDLIAGNVLVRAGRLVGVIDVGGLAPADPALDLVVGWHLLDRRRREILRDDLAADEWQWRRGMAWAFEQAIGLVWYYRRSNPPLAMMGTRTLRRILAAF